MLNSVVILVGGIGANSSDVVFILVNSILDLSGLVAVTCTQAPVGIEAILATHADDVRGLEISLHMVSHIVVLVATVVADAHRLVGHILVVQADDATLTNHTGQAAHETPGRLNGVVARVIITIECTQFAITALFGSVEAVAVLIAYERGAHIVGVAHVIIGGRMEGGTDAQGLGGLPDEASLEVDAGTLAMQVVVQAPIGRSVHVGQFTQEQVIVIGHDIGVVQ